MEHVLRAAEAISKMVPLLVAFILGIWVNAVSDPLLHEPIESIGRVYNIDRPLSWITIVATALAVIVPVARRVIPQISGSKRQATRLFERLQQRVVEPELWPFCKGRLAWGDQLVLQGCPSLNEGWRPQEVQIVEDPTEFRWKLPEESNSYEKWLESADEFVHRGPKKFRLLTDPISFLDDPELILKVQPNKFSQAVFVNRELSLVRANRISHIERVVNGQNYLPHLFVLHATIATSDGYFLMTKRSHKVAFHPETWSCSIEEQLAAEDLARSERDVLSRWGQRALTEELGLDETQAGASDMRALAIFLECDILNVGLAALITLNMDHLELDRVLHDRPRKDREFTDWKFISWQRLAQNLVHPDVRLHPSSGLRMYLCGMVKHGVNRFCDQVERELRRRTDH